jgi:hypothetical protein
VDLASSATPGADRGIAPLNRGRIATVVHPTRWWDDEGTSS